MTSEEPARAWQNEQHHRILRRDVIAFAQLCELALPHLISFLEARFVHAEDHLHQSIATDSLLSYRANPTQYNPDKLSLFAFLRMAAKNDMLNALDKAGRVEQRLLDIDDHGVQSQLALEDTPSKELDRASWLQQYTDQTPSDILQTLADELNPTDQQVLLLMCEGVRPTARYAEVLGITHLPEDAQRREVKRVKDRLNKKLQRFGQQLSQNQGENVEL